MGGGESIRGRHGERGVKRIEERERKYCYVLYISHRGRGREVWDGSTMVTGL